MRKIIIDDKQVQTIITQYRDEKLSTNDITKSLGLPKKRILTILKENNIEMRSSGRKFLGGKVASDKRWNENNKEYISNVHKKWREDKREHLNNYHKKWREANIVSHRINKNNYEKSRKSTDPTYKLISNFRTALYTALKEKNVLKNGKYFEILGYTIEDLINHLESQFKDGLTWDNYGEWHVDHKRPISSFNFTNVDDDEFKQCWSLSNLQPLWGRDNLSKSNKLI